MLHRVRNTPVEHVRLRQKVSKEDSYESSFGVMIYWKNSGLSKIENVHETLFGKVQSFENIQKTS